MLQTDPRQSRGLTGRGDCAGVGAMLHLRSCEACFALRGSKHGTRAFSRVQDATTPDEIGTALHSMFKRRVFCRSKMRPLVAALHSIFQRGDVGGADEADWGFVRFAVLGDDHRFQRLVVGEHRIDIV